MTALRCRRLPAVLLCLLAGCMGERTPSTPRIDPADAHAAIDTALPKGLADRGGWNADIYASFATLTVVPTHENICAVVAEIQQESSFRTDPRVPNLGPIALEEIDARAAHAGVPRVIVHGVLDLKSSTGKTYRERIDAARTEKELSDIYEDFLAAVPLGNTLFADKNPIRTRGPMQVNVAFANAFAAVKTYPYPVQQSIPDEVFTRRGSIYFGVAHLLDYSAPYDDYLYRFADFNAGQYASRNAAFQQAVSTATGVQLKADGALLPHDGDASIGSTEAAVDALATRLKLSGKAVHAALERGKTKDFEHSSLYERVFALADQMQGHPVPRARIPQITLQGPKLKHALTTDWYAHRVDEKFKRCLQRF